MVKSAAAKHATADACTLPCILLFIRDQGKTLKREAGSGVVQTLPYFSDGIGSGRNCVFELDVRGEWVPLFAHELEDFFDGRVALAPRRQSIR